MKAKIASILLLLTMGTGVMVAQDGYFGDRRDSRRDIQQDKRQIKRDQSELRRALRRGDYYTAQRERAELRHEYRDVNRDRRQTNVDWR